MEANKIKETCILQCFNRINSHRVEVNRNFNQVKEVNQLPEIEAEMIGQWHQEAQ